MGLFDGNTTTSNQYSPEVTNFVNQTLAQAGNLTDGMTAANSVAGLTDDQKNAFGMVRANAGAWQNPLAQTKELFTTAGSRGQSMVNDYAGSRAGLQAWGGQGYTDLASGIGGISARTAGVGAPIDTSVGTDYSAWAEQAAKDADRGYNLINAAGTTAQGALSRADVAGVRAGTVGSTDLSAYTDPYARSVLGTTTQEIQRNTDIANNAARIRAGGAGGTGGAGAALLQGQNNRAGADATARASAQIMSDAYKQAQATAAGDLDRTLTADTTTAQAQNAESLQRRQNALEVAGIQNAGAGTVASLANSRTGAASTLMQNQQTEAQRKTATELALRENTLKAAGLDLDALKAQAAAGDAAAGRMLQTFGLGQDAYKGAAGIESTAGAGMLGAAETGQQLSMNDIQALLGIGSVQQQQQQNELNVPKDALNIRLATVQGQPLNSSGMAPSGNTAAQVVGGGAALIGALRGLFG